MQAWSTNSDYGLSDRGQTMGMRVGIDPFGGTDAFSPNVVWTSPWTPLMPGAYTASRPPRKTAR